MWQQCRHVERCWGGGKESAWQQGMQEYCTGRCHFCASLSIYSLDVKETLLWMGVNPSLWQWLCGACITGCARSHTRAGGSTVIPGITSAVSSSSAVMSCRGQHLCSCGHSVCTASLHSNWGRKYKQIFLISYDYPNVVWSEKNRLYSCKLGCICLIIKTQNSSQGNQLRHFC